MLGEGDATEGGAADGGRDGVDILDSTFTLLMLGDGWVVPAPIFLGDFDGDGRGSGGRAASIWMSDLERATGDGLGGGSDEATGERRDGISGDEGGMDRGVIDGSSLSRLTGGSEVAWDDAGDGAG